MKIEILSPEMASRIAAGEVVERPASVVKELLENSIDAGATEITVSLEKSGTTSIRVIDNGAGILAEDLVLAVERHATSKLKTADDLFSIATLGFRGEALPSMASVGRMEITSRPPYAQAACRLNVEGGQRSEPRVTAAGVGTTVELKDLFYNVPARRKFLKSLATEFSHICDVINRTALAYPNIHFRLVHNDRTVAEYAAVTETRNRLDQVLGNEIAGDLIPFAYRQNGLGIDGFLSSAPRSFPNARHLVTFVNHRYVRDKIVTHAILQGYETLLMKGQYPAAVLSIEVAFHDVDVNVHPAKYEVRFRRQNDIHEGVARAVRQALGRQAKDPSPIYYPAIPESFPGVLESPLRYADAGFGPAQTSHTPFLTDAFPLGAPAAPRSDGFFSSLNVLGQIVGCYLVCSSSRGLALIDQHAAHERVAFERMRRQMSAAQVEKQTLLIPQVLELSAGEMMLIEKQLAVLEKSGFILEIFGPNAYAITAVPALLPEGDYRSVVRQMLAELAEIGSSEKLGQHLEERLATIACHSVIRANRQLEMHEMRALLQDLDETAFATQCPHGRPVLLEFSRDELERMFKRIV